MEILKAEVADENGIIPIVPKASSGQVPANGFDKNAFTFDVERGGYICPIGAFLSPGKRRTGKSTATADFIKYANRFACGQCQQKSKCTANKYRTVQDKPLGKFSRAVYKRVKENPDVYHLQKQLVVHPFGTIKRALGFTYFLTKGAGSVRAESHLHFLIYNMKRAINQVGASKLIEMLEG